MKKFIFLDIDGPLNTGRNDHLDPERYGHHFDNEAVQNLRRIVESTNAAIVISSSWRYVGVSRIQELWKQWNLPGEIVGCTLGYWGDEESFATRGLDIQRWLEKNAEGSYRFVVIDDFSAEEATEDQKAYWITVNPHCGISKENADWAIQLLNQL